MRGEGVGEALPVTPFDAVGARRAPSPTPWLPGAEERWRRRPGRRARSAPRTRRRSGLSVGIGLSGARATVNCTLTALSDGHGGGVGGRLAGDHGETAGRRRGCCCGRGGAHPRRRPRRSRRLRARRARRPPRRSTNDAGRRSSGVGVRLPAWHAAPGRLYPAAVRSDVPEPAHFRRIVAVFFSAAAQTGVAEVLMARMTPSPDTLGSARGRSPSPR